MNRAELRALTRRMLGSPLPAVVRENPLLDPDSAIDEYVNDALREMSGHVGGVEASDTITLVAGTRLYGQPARFVGERDVRYVAGADDERPLTKVSKLADRPPDYRTRTGEPVQYYWEGLQIGLYPIPGTAEAGKSVRVDGWFEAEDLTADSDVPTWPLTWHRCIATLAAAVICEAQARAEAQSSNSDISADSVQQDARTRMYAFRAADLRKMYETELRRVRGVGRL